MIRLNGRIAYRLFVAIYLSLAICGFFTPLSIVISLAEKGDTGAVIKGLIILFTPYIFLAVILVTITLTLKLRHTSSRRYQTAILFSIFSLIIVIVSVVLLLHGTSLRWAEIYSYEGSMAGSAEWIIGWTGGCASGLFVLSIGYLSLIRRSNIRPE